MGIVFARCERLHAGQRSQDQHARLRGFNRIEAERFHGQNSIPGSQAALSAARGQRPAAATAAARRQTPPRRPGAGGGGAALRVETSLDGSWARQKDAKPILPRITQGMRIRDTILLSAQNTPLKNLARKS